MRYRTRLISTVSIVIFFCGITAWADSNAAAADEYIIVFAAASTTNAITEIVDFYGTQGLGRIKTSFASSSTLAKQIQSGAPADIYLSANKKWMDFLEKKGMIQEKSRFDLLSNRIALIVPLESPFKTISIKKGLEISSFLGDDGRMAIGDPDHVPAGIYGKQALESLGLWNQVKDRLAPMKDVRAALVLVERSESPLGLVYTTDAAISRKVRIIGTFPPESHSPIVYPAALMSGGNKKAGTAFLEYLKTPEARSIFMKFGFEVK